MRYIALLFLAGISHGQVVRQAGPPTSGAINPTYVTVSGSETITGAGGLSTTYGVVAGSITVGGTVLTANVASGNVGIGTTNPATKLHMSSGTLTIDGTAPTITIGGAADGLVRSPAGANLTLAAPTQAQAVSIGDAATQYNTLRVTGGQVGVNGAPLRKLHVQNPAAPIGTGNSWARFSDETTGVGLDFGSANSTPYSHYIQASNNAWSSTFPLVLNPSGGGVGVNTNNTPLGATLDVNGSAQFGSGAAKSTATVTGDYLLAGQAELALGAFTTAQVQAKTPNRAGTLIYNSTLSLVCVSTGTTVQGYARLVAGGTCQ